MSGILSAIRFFTIVRVPAEDFQPRRLAACAPAAGLLIGLMLACVDAVALRFWSVTAASAIDVVFLTVISGALHLDGLADTADGLGGGRTPEERLRIMKDSRVGAFGVISLILGLVLKFSLFLSLSTQTRGAEALVLFPVVSRWGMVLLAYLSPYARPEGGLGQAMTLGVSPRVLTGSSLSAGALSLLILGVPGLVLFAAAAALVWLGSLYFQRRLGGITGDVLGATNEVLEVLVLAGALILT